MALPCAMVALWICFGLLPEAAFARHSRLPVPLLAMKPQRRLQATRQRLVCDIQGASAVTQRASKGVRNVIKDVIRDLDTLNKEADSLLSLGGAKNAIQTLSSCDDGPGSKRPPDYCRPVSAGGMGVCPPPCTAECPDRDWLWPRNWPNGTFTGFADCSADRTAEIQAGNDYVNDPKQKFVLNGNDAVEGIGATGWTPGNWIGLRKREHDVSIAANARALIPTFSKRNEPTVGATWMTSAAGLTTYYPSMPSLGLANWTMTDVIGLDFLGATLTSNPANNYTCSGGVFWDIAAPYHNPKGVAAWTKPYEDIMGAGMMLSAAKPWYFTGTYMGVQYNNTYLGIFGMDLILADQQSKLDYLRLTEDSVCAAVNDDLDIVITPSRFMKVIFDNPSFRPEDAVMRAAECGAAAGSAECNRGLTKATTADFSKLKEFMKTISPGNTGIYEIDMRYGNHTVSAAIQKKTMKALVVVEKWVPTAKDGAWNVMCMQPKDQITSAVAFQIDLTDDASATAHLAKDGRVGLSDVLELRSKFQESSTDGRITISNTGIYEFCVHDIVAPAGITLPGITTQGLSFCLLAGTSKTLNVTTKPDAVTVGTNTMRIDLSIKAHSDYTDCLFARTESRFVDLFVEAPPCPAGATFEGGQCVPCPVGTYQPARDGACFECPPGSFASQTQRTACSPCSIGNYANKSGAITCKACPKGTAAPKEQTVLCDICEAGRYSEGGAPKCEYCERGFYSDDPGQSACVACKPQKTTREIASTAKSDCICSASVPLHRASTDTCLPCPIGLTCPEGANNDVKTQKEFMAFMLDRSEANIKVWACQTEDGCPGALAPYECGSHFDGNSVACGSCVDGYYRSQMACKECDSIGGGYLFFAVLALMAGGVVVLYYLGNSAKSASNTSSLASAMGMGMLMACCQVYAVTVSLPVNLPPALQGIFGFFKIFLFDFSLLGTECMLKQSPTMDYMMRALFPVCLLIWIVLCFIGSKPFGVSRAWTINKTLNTVGFLGQVLIVTLTAISVDPLRCYPHPNRGDNDSDRASLRNYPITLCYSGEWTGMLIMGIIAFCVYVVPFMSVAAFAVYTAPSVKVDQLAAFNIKFRYLFARFRPEYWWYGLVFLGRSVAISLVPAISPSNATLAVILMQPTLMIPLVLVTMLQPWLLPMLNMTDIITSALLMAMIGSLPFFEPVDETDKLPTTWVALISMSNIFIYSFTVAVAVINIFRGKPMPMSKTKAMTSEVPAMWLKLAQNVAKLNEDNIVTLINAMTVYDVKVLMAHLSFLQKDTDLSVAGSGSGSWMTKRKSGRISSKCDDLRAPNVADVKPADIWV